MIELKLDHRLFAGDEMSFAVRLDDPKSDDLVVDYQIRWQGDVYFITKTQVVTDEQGIDLKRILAEIGWMRLANLKHPGNFVIQDQHISAGMAQILDGSGWVLGNYTDNLTRTLELTDQSFLTWVWEWCRVTGTEPVFHTIGKVIDMVDMAGIDRGLRFEYGRNIKEIIRTETPPEFTRLYMFGRDDLTMVSVAGNSYVEDYSWYTNLGIPLATAQELHRKEEIVYDDNILDASVLHANAVTKLEAGSQGLITYDASVLDLSAISGVPELQLAVGDRASVQDAVVSLTLPVRVSRFVEFPNEPENNQVELAFGLVLLPAVNQSNSRPNTSRNWELFVSRNTGTPREIRLGHQIINRIKLRTVDDAEWVVGYSLKAVGVGSSTVTLEFEDTESLTPWWTTKTFAVTNGQEIDFSINWGELDIPAGITTLVVRAYSDSTTAGINISDDRTNLWVLARGTTRENVTLPNSIRFDYTGAIQNWEAPDDVGEIQVEAHGAAGGLSVAGNGGMVKAMFAVIAGTLFDVIIGGRSKWPNGGDAGQAGPFTGGVGGGSTDLRPSGTGFTSALIVAAGGGGSGESSASNPNPFGGDGGFHIGDDSQHGQGATQYSPGDGLSSGEAGDTDGLGQGGDGSSSGNAFDFGGGGGGGGWHGGEGGQAATPPAQSGGGGGSGWIDAASWDLEFLDGENSDDGYMIISWETPEEI